MKKSPLPKPITILVLTLLTALVWVSLSIYRAITVKPAATVSENISKALNPSLNTDVIQKIESAVFIPDSEIPEISITNSKTKTPAPVVTQTPGPIATPQASESANLEEEI